MLALDGSGHFAFAACRPMLSTVPQRSTCRHTVLTGSPVRKTRPFLKEPAYGMGGTT
jgi:hypothetical protein